MPLIAMDYLATSSWFFSLIISSTVFYLFLIPL